MSIAQSKVTGLPGELRKRVKRADSAQNAGRYGGLQPVTSVNSWLGPEAGSNQSVTPAAGWSDAVITTGTYKKAYKLCYDCTGIRLVYDNCYNDNYGNADGVDAPPWSSTDDSGDITIKARILWNSKKVRVRFNGSYSATISPGCRIISDPISVDFRTATSADFWVYTNITIAAGKRWPLGLEMTVNDPTNGGGKNQFYANATDLTDWSTSDSANGFKNCMYHPSLVVGITNPRVHPVVGFLGDSIISGYYNNQVDGSSDNDKHNHQGWADLGLADALPTVKLSRGGDLANRFADPLKSHWRRGLLEQCTHVVVAYGTNDIANSRTANQIETDLLAIYNYCDLLGIKVFAATIPPRTTSSDSWTAAGNQTVAATESVRIAVNTWIRTVPSPLSGVIDVCTPIEVNASNVLTLNGGFWKTSGVAQHYTYAGVHPSHDGHVLMGSMITAALFTI